MKHIRTAPVLPFHRGVELKPTTETFEDRSKAEEYAREKRSYVAPATEYDDETDEEKRIWYVPL